MQDDEVSRGDRPPAETTEAASRDDDTTGTRPDVGSRRGAFTGGLWSAASTVLPLGGTLALSVVISRELGATVLGEQSLVAYVASMMVSVLIYSFTTASVQLLAAATGGAEADRLAWLSRWSFGAHLVGGVVAAGVLVGGGLGRDSYQDLWFLAAATALVDSIGWAHASRDIARHGWTATSTRRLVAQAASPVAAIAAVYLGWGVRGVFAVQLAVALVLLLALRRLDRSEPAPSTRGRTAPPWRPVLQLWSLFALSALIIQVVERRLELVFLDSFHDARTVAMYSVAFSLVAIPTTLSGSLIHAAMPAIAARHVQDPGSVLASLSRAARVVVTIDVVLAAGTVAVGPQLVTTIYGEDFAEAADLVRWLGLTLLVVPLGQLYGALWSGIGQLRPVLVSGGAGALVDIVLAFLLIPGLSTTGAVIATISAQATSAAILIVHTFRSGLGLELRLRRLAASTGVAVVAATAAVVAGPLVDGLLGDLVAVLLFGGLLAVGARLVGLFDPEDARWLAGTVPGPAARVLRALSPAR